MERTLIVVKPDAVQRKLVGRIIAAFEEKGFKVVGMKMVLLTDAQAQEMYDVHKAQPFYARLVRFMTSGPVVAMVLEGNQAVRVARALIGATCGPDAQAGTIRGDWSLSQRYNLVHSSDSPESVQREIELFFGSEELVDYSAGLAEWLYDKWDEAKNSGSTDAPAGGSW